MLCVIHNSCFIDKIEIMGVLFVHVTTHEFNYVAGFIVTHSNAVTFSPSSLKQLCKLIRPNNYLAFVFLLFYYLTIDLPGSIYVDAQSGYATSHVDVNQPKHSVLSRRGNFIR